MPAAEQPLVRSCGSRGECSTRGRSSPPSNLVIQAAFVAVYNGAAANARRKAHGDAHEGADGRARLAFCIRPCMPLLPKMLNLARRFGLGWL